MVIKRKEGEQTFNFNASPIKKIEEEGAITTSPTVVEADQSETKEEVQPSASATTLPARDGPGTAAARVINNWYLKSDGNIKGKVCGHPRRDDESIFSLKVDNSVNREELKVGSVIESKGGTPYLLGVPKPLQEHDERCQA